MINKTPSSSRLVVANFGSSDNPALALLHVNEEGEIVGDITAYDDSVENIPCNCETDSVKVRTELENLARELGRIVIRLRRLKEVV